MGHLPTPTHNVSATIVMFDLRLIRFIGHRRPGFEPVDPVKWVVGQLTYCPVMVTFDTILGRNFGRLMRLVSTTDRVFTKC